MKENVNVKILVLIGLFLFDFLFYRQWCGINFSLILVYVFVISAIQKRGETFSLKNILPITLTVITSLSVLINGFGLGVLLFVFAVSWYLSCSYENGISVVSSVFHSVDSIAGSGLDFVQDLISKKRKEDGLIIEEDKENTSGISITQYILIAVILIAFFFIYRAGSTLFTEITNKINLDFISLPLIGFTILGILPIAAIVYYKLDKNVFVWEKNQSEFLEKESEDKNIFGGKVVSVISEIKSAFLLLIILNLMVAIVNSGDIYQLYFGGSIGKNINRVDSIHESTGLMIFSIIAAISVILIYFRGAINFNESNKNVKLLAYLWIGQNLLMLINLAFKNYEFIDLYSLTYKRIGIMVWLIMVLGGLIYTWLKIKNKFSNWLLIKYNSATIFTTLCVFSVFNWDIIITNYNISQAIEKKKPLEVDYLFALNNEVLPIVYKATFNTDIRYCKYYDFRGTNNVEQPASYNLIVRQDALTKLKEWNKNYIKPGWQSFNISTNHALAETKLILDKK